MSKTGNLAGDRTRLILFDQSKRQMDTPDGIHQIYQFFFIIFKSELSGKDDVEIDDSIENVLARGHTSTISL